MGVRDLKTMITKIADFWDVTFYSHAPGSTSDMGFLSIVQNIRKPPLSLCNYCTPKRVIEISQLVGGTGILTFRNQ